MLDICLLGTGGMMPLPYRWLTSLMARYNGSSLLIDCGEGTQIAIREKGGALSQLMLSALRIFMATTLAGSQGFCLLWAILTGRRI